jgi:hypothetical protein
MARREHDIPISTDPSLSYLLLPVTLKMDGKRGSLLMSSSVLGISRDQDGFLVDLDL